LPLIPPGFSRIRFLAILGFPQSRTELFDTQHDLFKMAYSTGKDLERQR